MKKYRTLIISLLGVVALTSCGDVLEIPETIKPTEMTLDQHSLVVMVGDKIQVSPSFKPDDVSNTSVWWKMGDEQVAAVKNGLVYGLKQGNTMLHAYSVLNQIGDSCTVSVIKDWAVSFRSDYYRYDMVVYARMTLGGQPLPADVKVAAMCGDVVRGVGIRRNRQGIEYMEIRVYSNSPQGETIHFVYYKPGTGLGSFGRTLSFDEETHGTLSNLFEISN